MAALENVKESSESFGNLMIESQDMVNKLNTRLRLKQRKDADIRQTFQTFRREILERGGKVSTVTKVKTVLRDTMSNYSIQDVCEMEREEDCVSAM